MSFFNMEKNTNVCFPSCYQAVAHYEEVVVGFAGTVLSVAPGGSPVSLHLFSLDQSAPYVGPNYSTWTK